MTKSIWSISGHLNIGIIVVFNGYAKANTKNNCCRKSGVVDKHPMINRGLNFQTNLLMSRSQSPGVFNIPASNWLASRFWRALYCTMLDFENDLWRSFRWSRNFAPHWRKVKVNFQPRLQSQWAGQSVGFWARVLHMEQSKSRAIGIIGSPSVQQIYRGLNTI